MMYQGLLYMTEYQAKLYMELTQEPVYMLCVHVVCASHCVMLDAAQSSDSAGIARKREAGE